MSTSPRTHLAREAIRTAMNSADRETSRTYILASIAESLIVIADSLAALASLPEEPGG